MECVNLWAKLWARPWANGVIVIKYDDEAEVCLTKGLPGTVPWLPWLGTWFVTASYNIKLKLIHTPGIQNVSADLSSR